MACCTSASAVQVDKLPSAPPSASPPLQPEGDSIATKNDVLIGVTPAEVASVMVAVRIRPFNAKETAAKSFAIAEAVGVSSVRLTEEPAGQSKAIPTDREFTFDAVLGQAAKQADAYQVTGAAILPKFLAGYNACLFAYGQTGSGKTYTMEGTPGAEAGVMSRLCENMFDMLHKSNDSVWTLEATYVEIYQESLRDLLVGSSSSRPPTPISSPMGMPQTPVAYPGMDTDNGPVIRQTPDGQIILEGAVQKPVRSVGDVLAIIAEGTLRRTRGETAMNAVSSRSHAVLTLHLTTRKREDEDGLTQVVRKLHLIDLAGSERADAAQTTGVRLKEGAKINLSLLMLGNVINALTIPGRTHVPYRDSKLTRLLQDSLGANAYCMMILCVSPASINYDETLSSLRFAERVKKVKNAPQNRHGSRCGTNITAACRERFSESTDRRPGGKFQA
jgi:hypothetical protein